MTTALFDHFRVHAQLLPDSSVLVEPGLYADATGVRALGPAVLAIPANLTAELRVDRIALDRSSGSFVVLSGGAEAPVLGAGQVALARVLMDPGATLVREAAIVDERALWIGGGDPPPPALLVRRVARDFGTRTTQVNTHTLHQLLFEDTGISVGGALEDSVFTAPARGNYQVTCSVGVSNPGTDVISRICLNTQRSGEGELQRTFSNAYAKSGVNAVAIVSDVLQLEPGDKLTVYAMKATGLAKRTDTGGADISFLLIQRVG